MGILSTSVSITQYRVEGKLADPVMETIYNGLNKDMITDIDEEETDMVAGWTCFESPFKPNFEGYTFSCGPYLIFSLRIDKKNIPPKVLKKYLEMAYAQRLAETGRDYLSKGEKREIRDYVEGMLNQRIPAVPNVYDILWHYEQARLWFFSTQKSANETLETMFRNTFNLTLIRLFPYTMAYLLAGLTDSQRDLLDGLTSTSFLE